MTDGPASWGRGRGGRSGSGEAPAQPGGPALAPLVDGGAEAPGRTVQAAGNLSGSGSCPHRVLLLHVCPRPFLPRFVSPALPPSCGTYEGTWPGEAGVRWASDLLSKPLLGLQPQPGSWEPLPRVPAPGRVPSLACPGSRGSSGLLGASESSSVWEGSTSLSLPPCLHPPLGPRASGQQPGRALATRHGNTAIPTSGGRSLGLGHR